MFERKIRQVPYPSNKSFLIWIRISKRFRILIRTTKKFRIRVHNTAFSRYRYLTTCRFGKCTSVGFIARFIGMITSLSIPKVFYTVGAVPTYTRYLPTQHGRQVYRQVGNVPTYLLNNGARYLKVTKLISQWSGRVCQPIPQVWQGICKFISVSHKTHHPTKPPTGNEHYRVPARFRQRH